MNIYFARHGETVFNAENRVQNSETELSPAGLQQARQLATRCLEIDFDVIISSPQKRTMQTSQAVLDKKTVPIVKSELFIEWTKPKEFWHANIDDAFEEQWKPILRQYKNPDYHYSDEENFYECLARTVSARHYIENCPEQNILIVSHSTFIRFFTLSILLGEHANYDTVMPAARHLAMNNTGLTHFTLKDSHWRLINWNDQAHL